MNLFALNGETLNGSQAALSAAASDITGTVNVGASATRFANVAADAGGNVSLAATPRVIRGVAASVDLAVDFTTSPKLTQAAAASVGGSVDIQGFVYRNVPGTANFDCSVQFGIIPASTLGAANITPAAALVATGTRVQPGRSDALGTVSITAAPKVTRFVSAALGGAVNVRPEAQRNKSVDAYADIACSVTITTPSSGIVQCQGVAAITLLDDFVADCTYIYRSAAVLIDASCEAYSMAQTFVPSLVVFAPAPAALVAQATRVAGAAAAFSVAGDVTARATQKFGSASAVFDAAADAAAASTAITSASTQATGTCTITADAARLRLAEATINGYADMTAAALSSIGALASIAPTASISSSPTRICLATVDGVIVPGFAASASILNSGAVNVDPSADIVANSRQTAHTSALVDASVDVVPQPIVRVFPRLSLALTVNIVADARLNIEAYDPPHRTMYRPALDTEIRRPFIDTEMRRVA